MDQADDIFMQTLNELRRQLAAVRKLGNALSRRKQARRMLEGMRNARSQNPELDNWLNREPDRARQWGDTERELRELQSENARLAADNEQRLAAIQENQGELERQQAELDDRDRDGIPDPRQDLEDFDRDHVPDRTERLDQQAADRQQAEELQDAAENRDEQADDSERADELEDAADDREEQADQDERTAEQREQDERRREREEGQDGPDVGTTAAAAGTAAVVADELEDERDERAEDLDGAEPEQVQGAQGPEVEQGGQTVGRDDAAQPAIGDDQQPGQAPDQQAGQGQQGASADRSGPQAVTIGSINGGAFAVGSNARATVNVYGQGQDQPGVDQPGAGEPDGPGGQGQRPDPLESQLAEAREENGRGTVRVGSVSNSTINGVRIGDQGLPAGEFTSRDDGGVDYRGTTPDGQDVKMQFGPGATAGGKPIDAAELNRIQGHQDGIPPAGSPQPEGRAPAVATGHGGKTAGAQAAASKGGAGRGNEGGREPEGRG